MPSTSFLLGASLLAGAAFAAPVAQSDAPLQRRVAQPGDKLKIEARIHYRAASTRLVKKDTGDVVGYYDGGGWILPVLIGGQEVALNIDTGSSDLWTASTLLSAQEQALVKPKFGNLYDPTKSANYSAMDGYTYSLSYADSSHSSGNAATDTVDIGGATVPKMPFGVCNSLALGTGQTSRDTMGPVGLGFGVENSIRPTPQATFMEALEPYVSEPVFSTQFRPNNDGTIQFGYSDTSLYTGDLTTISIKNTTQDLEGQWGTTSVSFGIGGKQFSAAALDMDFDSGTSSLSLSSDVASAYFAQVSGASNSGGSYSYPCSSTLPDLDFIFSTSTAGPSTVTVPGKYIASQNNPTSGTCGTAINVVTGRGNAGQPFYMSKYMIWSKCLPNACVFLNMRLTLFRPESSQLELCRPDGCVKSCNEHHLRYPEMSGAFLRMKSSTVYSHIESMYLILEKTLQTHRSWLRPCSNLADCLSMCLSTCIPWKTRISTCIPD